MVLLMALRRDRPFQLSIGAPPLHFMLDNSFDLLQIVISPEVVLDLILHFHNGQHKSKNLPMEA